MSLINYENVEKFKILYILTHPTVEVQQWAYMFIVHGVVNQIGSSTCLELFVVHGLRLFAVSEHFWWFLNLYKNLDCKSTEIIPPTTVKGKCKTAMYTMLHIPAENSQCGIRSCPPK